MANLKINGTPVRYVGDQIENAYFCLTDMAQPSGDARFLIRTWLRNSATLDFIHVWESERNEDFKDTEFGIFKSRSGRNNFMTSIDELVSYNCKSVFSKKGRYGGSFGHVVLAFHFANWLSPEFYHAFVTSFINRNSFTVKRLWSRLNYRLHTEGVKSSLPPVQNKRLKGLEYASEADMLNLAVFGSTAKEWRAQNPEAKGNRRDHASPAQLHVLANLEMLNSYLLKNKMSKEERAVVLVQEADYQFSLLFALDQYKR
ncbi:MAG: KilA-N domain-containing protein [Bacteroidota bacterium]